MVEKANITSEEFDRRKAQPNTRWAELLEKLKAGTTGDVFAVSFARGESDSQERERVRQSIYAIAKYHGIRVQSSIEGDSLLVKHAGRFQEAGA